MELTQQLQFVIERIKGIRHQKHISQLQLANKADLSQSFLASIETGKKRPSVITILKIANALEISARDLFPESCTKDTSQIKNDIINLLDNL